MPIEVLLALLPKLFEGVKFVADELIKDPMTPAEYKAELVELRAKLDKTAAKVAAAPLPNPPGN